VERAAARKGEQPYCLMVKGMGKTSPSRRTVHFIHKPSLKVLAAREFFL